MTAAELRKLASQSQTSEPTPDNVEQPVDPQPRVATVAKVGKVVKIVDDNAGERSQGRIKSRGKRPRTIEVDEPEETEQPTLKKHVPDWDVTEGDTIFPDAKANPPERTVTRELLRGLSLPRDRELLEGRSARYSLSMAGHLLVKSGVWMDHALEAMAEDNKKLEDLTQRLHDADARAKRAEDEASEAKRLRSDADRLRESAETALAIEKSAREALEKKHAEDTQKYQAENLGLIGKVHQLNKDLLQVEVHTFTLGYNDCILVAKEKGLDYKTLLLNPEVDTTVQAEGDPAGNPTESADVEILGEGGEMVANPNTPAGNSDGSDGRSPLI